MSAPAESAVAKPAPATPARIATIVILILGAIVAIFDLAAATGPWAYNSISFGGNTVKSWLGLLQSITCVGSTCVTDSNLSDLPNAPASQAAAAMLLLGFLSALAVVIIEGLQLARIPFAAGSAFASLLSWSIATFVFTFIGCIVGGSTYQSEISNSASGYPSPGLGLSIVSVIFSAVIVAGARMSTLEAPASAPAPAATAVPPTESNVPSKAADPAAVSAAPV